MQRRAVRFMQQHAMLGPGDRVGVAVSGGADSVALLRLLFELCGELGIVLSVIHLDHGWRGEAARADSAFVAELANHFGLAFHGRQSDAASYARQHELGLEAAGRRLRYGFFCEVAAAERLQCVATGHTLDDQAETVLFKLLRGAWTRGLAGIYPVQPLGSMGNLSANQTQNHAAKLIRPLLNHRRSELRAYLESAGQAWREDASNADLSFARNRIRSGLLPLLERGFNPALPAVLSGLAEIAREEEAFWQTHTAALAAELAPPLPRKRTDCSPRNIRFDSKRFRVLLISEQRRLAIFLLESQIGRSLDFEHVEAARQVLNGTVGSTALPGGWQLALSRRGGEIILAAAEPNQDAARA